MLQDMSYHTLIHCLIDCVVYILLRFSHPVGSKDIEANEQILGVFLEKQIIAEAVTHSSAFHEARRFIALSHKQDNGTCH